MIKIFLFCFRPVTFEQINTIIIYPLKFICRQFFLPTTDKTETETNDIEIFYTLGRMNNALVERTHAETENTVSLPYSYQCWGSLFSLLTLSKRTHVKYVCGVGIYLLLMGNWKLILARLLFLFCFLKFKAPKSNHSNICSWCLITTKWSTV